jgi:hypothetical protein
VLLAPAAVVTEPRERGQIRVLCRREEGDLRAQLAGRADGVVAADALGGAAAEPEVRAVVVRVRPHRRVDDRMGSADDLELVRPPVGALAPLVLAEAHLPRPAGERLGGRADREVELDHLPVALVLVVPVVVDVEEPVLERELVGIPPLGDDPRVRPRLRSRDQVPLPVLVVAAGVKRVAREVEVVAEEPGREIPRSRADLHHGALAPRAVQGDLGVPEHEVGVDRLERLAVLARLRLGDEADDRRVAVGQLLLRALRGSRGREGGRRENGEHGRNQASDHGFI